MPFVVSQLVPSSFETRSLVISYYGPKNVLEIQHSNVSPPYSYSSPITIITILDLLASTI